MKSVVEQINIDHVPLAILVVAVWFLLPQNLHTELQSVKKNSKIMSLCCPILSKASQ